MHSHLKFTHFSNEKSKREAKMDPKVTVLVSAVRSSPFLSFSSLIFHWYALLINTQRVWNNPLLYWNLNLLISNPP